MRAIQVAVLASALALTGAAAAAQPQITGGTPFLIVFEGASSNTRVTLMHQGHSTSRVAFDAVICNLGPNAGRYVTDVANPGNADGELSPGACVVQANITQLQIWQLGQNLPWNYRATVRERPRPPAQ